MMTTKKKEYLGSRVVALTEHKKKTDLARRARGKFFFMNPSGVSKSFL